MSALEVEVDSIEGADQPDDAEQYLTFIMDKEEYGVDILSVKEIRIWDSATPIPRAPSHVRGVINLRGTIVPIIDLRQCFSMPAIEYGPLTVVLVLQINSENGSREVGIVVDAVSDVHTLEPGQMKLNPDIGGQRGAQCIKGLADIDDKMVILLDMDKLLSQNEFSGVAEAKAMILDSTNEISG